MERNDRHLLIALGGGGSLLVGAIVGMAYGGTLTEWQGILGSIATVFAGWLAFSAVRQQIAQDRAFADERHKRESVAALAVLPMALGSIAEYAETAVRKLALYEEELEDPTIAASFTAPDFPISDVHILRDVMTLADAKGVAQMRDLLLWLQVVRDRLEKLEVVAADHTTAKSALEVQDYMIAVAQLHHYAERLFEPVRKWETDGRPRASTSEVRSALMKMRVYPGSGTGVFDRLGLDEE